MINFRVILLALQDDLDTYVQILPETIIRRKDRLHLKFFERFIHKLVDLLAIFNLGLDQVIHQFFIFV